MPNNNKLYNVLGVQPDATEADLLKAYRSKCQKLHPDKNPDDPEATNRFQAVVYAYKFLTDPVKRKHYDETGEEENTTESSAYQTISQIYAEIARKHNYVKRNYIVLVITAIQNSLRQCLHDKKGLESEVERITYLIDHTECDEAILHSLNVNLSQALHKQKHATEASEVMNLALEILDKVKYTGEIPTPTTPTTTSMGGKMWSTDPYIS